MTFLPRGQHYWELRCMEDKKERNKAVQKNKYSRPTIVIPFISDEVSHRIKKVVYKNSINCNVSFKNATLYNMTSSQTKKDIIEDPMSKAGVVYELRCEICNSIGKKVIYIG